MEVFTGILVCIIALLLVFIIMGGVKALFDLACRAFIGESAGRALLLAYAFKYINYLFWPFLLAIFGLVAFLGQESWGLPVLIVACAILVILIYLIPTYVCCVRDTQYKAGIILFNIFLGTTGLGWIIALIAASVVPKKDADLLKNVSPKERFAAEDFINRVKLNVLAEKAERRQSVVGGVILILSWLGFILCIVAGIWYTL